MPFRGVVLLGEAGMRAVYSAFYEIITSIVFGGTGHWGRYKILIPLQSAILVEYQFDGTCYYVPQMRPGYKLNTRWEVRWLGFENEDLYLWAEWDDDKFWEYIGTPKPELPKNLSMTYLLDFVKANLEPSFMLNNTKVHIQEVQRGEILILFGEYARFKDSCTRIKLKIADSNYTIGLMYYHHEPLCPEKFFGKEIQCANITFSNNRT